MLKKDWKKMQVNKNIAIFQIKAKLLRLSWLIHTCHMLTFNRDENAIKITISSNSVPFKTKTFILFKTLKKWNIFILESNSNKRAFRNVTLKLDDVVGGVAAFDNPNYLLFLRLNEAICNSFYNQLKKSASKEENFLFPSRIYLFFKKKNRNLIYSHAKFA